MTADYEYTAHARRATRGRETRTLRRGSVSVLSDCTAAASPPRGRAETREASGCHAPHVRAETKSQNSIYGTYPTVLDALRRDRRSLRRASARLRFYRKIWISGLTRIAIGGVDVTELNLGIPLSVSRLSPAARNGKPTDRSTAPHRTRQAKAGSAYGLEPD